MPPCHGCDWLPLGRIQAARHLLRPPQARGVRVREAVLNWCLVRGSCHCSGFTVTRNIQCKWFPEGREHSNFQWKLPSLTRHGSQAEGNAADCPDTSTCCSSREGSDKNICRQGRSEWDERWFPLASDVTGGHQEAALSAELASLESDIFSEEGEKRSTPSQPSRFSARSCLG